MTKKTSSSFIAKMAVAAALSFTALTPLSSSAFAQSADNEQIEWDLTDLYPTLDAWNAERERVNAKIQTISTYEGTLGNSAESLLAAFDAISAINKEAARVFIYASLGGDEDLRNAEGQERLGLARTMFAGLGQATAFIAPEILEIGENKIEAYIAEEPGLEKHAFQLRDILRQKQFTLGGEAEAVLANAGEVLGGPQRIYQLLSTAAIPWPKVTLASEQVVTLDQAAYTRYRAVPNREDRKKVFDAFWNTWKTYEAPFGQTLDTLVKTHIFTANSRGYENLAGTGCVRQQRTNRRVSRTRQGRER